MDAGKTYINNKTYHYAVYPYSASLKTPMQAFVCILDN